MAGQDAPEFACTFRDLLLQAMAEELKATCRVLAALPDDQHGYRPDPRSRSTWELAWHIAADVWFLEGIADHHFDLNPDRIHANPCATGKELAAWYERRSQQALERIRSMPGLELAVPVKLGGVAETGGYEMPAYQYLFWVHLHTVHHRGQLSAYLRPMGAKVPAIYGPSGDTMGP